MSSGTSSELTVYLWGDGHDRRIDASCLSSRGQSRDVGVEVDVLDFNDDQEPTVVLNVGTEAQHTLFMAAYDAERLGAFLIQAAALSRQVEPGGPNPMLIRKFPAEL
ncbi:MAG: hypothetical protein P4L48_23550 [Mycobacterium sp.]|nr:hypothetical protein [Mycobacterium sp.]MDR3662019.1 hypothetical protein [Mycobacterium sp.]